MTGEELTHVQRLQLELIRRAGANAFDGARVVDDLLAHRDLWDAALMEPRGLAALFGLPAGYWDADTLHLLPSGDRPGAAAALEELARAWDPDDVSWTREDLHVDRARFRRVLTLWWD